MESGQNCGLRRHWEKCFPRSLQVASTSAISDQPVTLRTDDANSSNARKLMIARCKFRKVGAKLKDPTTVNGASIAVFLGQNFNSLWPLAQ
jgi:hypothetical protein